MQPKTSKLPDADHPISIDANPGRIVVTVAGQVIADTRRALTLREAKYQAVHYVPRLDVQMQLLQPSEHQTFCPYKGDCTYFSIAVGAKKSMNAVWSYEHPNEAVKQIGGYLAFYPDRVDSIEIA